MILRAFLTLFILFSGVASLAQESRCQSVFASSAELTQLKELSRGNIEAFLGDKKVFLKKLKGDSKTEILWLEKINSLGLGVKLYQVTEINGQNYAVIEYFKGVNTQIAMMAPDGFILKKEAVEKIRAQAEILANNGIIPVDLQFQVSLDGKEVRIIDPELFQMAKTPQEALQKTQNILMGLFLPWSLEGKIEL